MKALLAAAPFFANIVVALAASIVGGTLRRGEEAHWGQQRKLSQANKFLVLDHFSNIRIADRELWLVDLVAIATCPIILGLSFFLLLADHSRHALYSAGANLAALIVSILAYVHYREIGSDQEGIRTYAGSTFPKKWRRSLNAAGQRVESQESSVTNEMRLIFSLTPVALIILLLNAVGAVVALSINL